MKTITIKTKEYTYQQAHQLLKLNGWPDDISAFLASLPADAPFTTLAAYKRQFRQWRAERNEQLTRQAWQRGLDELLQIPTIDEAYPVLLTRFQAKPSKRGQK